MARVTKTERNRAKRQARETARFERKSSEAATRLGFRMQSRVLRAFRQGDLVSISKIVEEEFRAVRPIMLEAMTIAYLVGLDRLKEVGTRAKPVAAANVGAPVHRSAIKFYFDRLSIDPARLREIQKAQEAQSLIMLTRLEDDVNRGLQRAMLRANQEGLTTREGTKAMREAFSARGITPTNPFEFETQFRTQTQLAYGAGTWDAAHDPVVDEILWGYKYVTVGDDRVRPEHAALDGTTARKNDPIWESIWTPNGWNCRCQILFLFEPEETSLPGPREIDGRIVTGGPDKGFDFNPGTVLSKGSGPRAPGAVGEKVLKKKAPWKKPKSKRRVSVAPTKVDFNSAAIARRTKRTKPLTAKQSETLADEIIPVAVRAEKTLTPIMQELADEHGTKLAGLEFRLKGKDSLVRKIKTESADNAWGVAQLKRDDLNDLVRYTMVADKKNYSDAVETTIRAMNRRGIESVNIKNYWFGDKYKGINGVFRDKATGHKFELQFHTRKSLARKEPSHLIYEKSRKARQGSALRAKLEKDNVALWVDVEAPRGIKKIGKLLLPKPEA